MSALESLRQRRLIFVIGAPRSGTTFVQHLLAAHPDVVTTQESELFSHYLAPWHERWEHHLPDDPETWRHQRYQGLPAIITAEQFREITASVIDRVYEQALALKPGATTVLDKVPANAEHGPLIHSYFPNAHFLQVIRDGRDVATSLMRAAKTWGRAWAPSRVEGAAARWRESVEHGRRLRELTDRYAEVRYEDLKGDGGAALLGSVFRSCGLDAGDAWAADLYERMARGEGVDSIRWGGEVIERLGGPPAELESFTAGGGKVGGWRTRLTPYEQWAFDSIAGDLLRDLGYAAGERRGAAAVKTTWYPVMMRGRMARVRLGKARRLLVGA